ncbi:uncharacterized protein LOC142226553 [Haematobia irritans]|uniref:uncharacterized protein LOC142226553 n=1 Tax=Haematobia irritans TaxID=7368 RepID=UPI003F4F66FA
MAHSGMHTFDSICSQDTIINSPSRSPSSTSLSNLYAGLYGPDASLVPSTAYGIALQGTKDGAVTTTTTSPDCTPAKCATVTMMLANRITRNAWSVEDEHFFESNHMSVWQTIEFLSGLTLRKRYNYEGYNDNNNSVLPLAPSWRRDGFVEKNVDPTIDEATRRRSAGPVTSGSDYDLLHQDQSLIGDGTAGGVVGHMGSVGAINSGVPAGRNRETGQKRKTGHNQAIGHVNNKKSSKRKHPADIRKKSNKSRDLRRKQRNKQELALKEVETEYALSPSDYVDLIKCTFNLPRISAALERLMGTNVVRLTDRNYMKELRERIEDDYRQNLQKRIKARELKEVERERILIIEGKTKDIPDELADDPSFVVGKKADLENSKARAKLKTNREKNSERLKLQGVRWERERQQHEEEEAQQLEEVRQRFKEQHQLGRQQTEEEAAKAVNSLRIHDEDWRPCEQRLREFLEQERAKMKERTERLPTPFTSDPKDMQSILRARKRFQETELRIRQHIDQQVLQQEDGQQPKLMTVSEVEEHKFQYGSKRSHDTDAPETFTYPDDQATMVQRNFQTEDTSEISSCESLDDDDITANETRKKYIKMLNQELEEKPPQIEEPPQRDQCEPAPCEDDKIMQLRNAKDIRELYQLAEEIIIGESIGSFCDEYQTGDEGSNATT